MGFLALSALAVFLVSKNQMAVENYVLKRVIHGVQARTGDIENLDDKVEALMAEGDVELLVAAILVDDEVVWIQGFGEEPALNKTHNIGSITKPFTATAVLQIYEQDLIDLDDDINEYLPFTVRHPDYPDVSITIRMLLANRSCLAHNNNMYYSYMLHPNLLQWGVKNRGWSHLGDLEAKSYAGFMAGYLNQMGDIFDQRTGGTANQGQNSSTPRRDRFAWLSGRASQRSVLQRLFAGEDLRSFGDEQHNCRPLGSSRENCSSL